MKIVIVSILLSEIVLIYGAVIQKEEFSKCNLMFNKMCKSAV